MYLPHFALQVQVAKFKASTTTSAYNSESSILIFSSSAFVYYICEYFELSSSNKTVKEKEEASKNFQTSGMKIRVKPLTF